MSYSSKPSDNSKPAGKDKDPHNYRKVGYSMIVISVSLVLILLLIMAVGNNYHFSGDLMAAQEIDAMTPKSGYNIVAFDYTQPVGAKIKLLGHVDNITQAQDSKSLHEIDYDKQKGIVLIFDSSQINNTNSVSFAEVFAMTPTNGYNIVSFKGAFPPGAKLSGLKLDPLLSNATKDAQVNSDKNKDSGTQILTFSTSYDDNLKLILGSKYDPDLVSKNINQFKTMMPKLIVPKPINSTTLIGANQTQIPQQSNMTTPVNSTMTTPVNSTMTTPVNSTMTTPVNSTMTTPVNSMVTNQVNATMTIPANMTIMLTNSTVTSSGPVIAQLSNQTKVTTYNDTSGTKSGGNENGTSKSLTISENLTITSKPK